MANKPGKAADIGEHATPVGVGDNGLDPGDKQVALVDIDAGLTVSGGGLVHG
jgi:hypothetical protein